MPPAVALVRCRRQSGRTVVEKISAHPHRARLWPSDPATYHLGEGVNWLRPVLSRCSVTKEPEEFRCVVRSMQVERVNARWPATSKPSVNCDVSACCGPGYSEVKQTSMFQRANPSAAHQVARSGPPIRPVGSTSTPPPNATLQSCRTHLQRHFNILWNPGQQNYDP